MEKEKKQNLLIIISSIILVLLIALTIYLIFFNKKEEYNEPSNHQSDTENIDSVSKELYSKIINYKLYHLTSSEKDTKYGSIPTQELLYAMYTYNYTGKNVMKSDVDKYFDEVLNIKLTQYPNYKCWNDDKNLFEYDAKKQAYVEKANEHGHGDYHYTFDIIPLETKKMDTNHYSIIVVPISSEPGIFYIQNDNGENIEYTEKEEDIEKDDKTRFNIVYEYFVKYANSHKSELNSITPKYQYTFEKINNNYYLREFKKLS